MCPYCYYDEQENYRPRLYCKLKNGGVCIYAKLCTKPEVNKYIPTEYMEECYLMNEELKKNIPNGSYYVRFIKDNFVYVEIGDEVKKFKNTLGGSVTNYVYIKNINSKDSEISLSPFKSNKKKKNG